MEKQTQTLEALKQQIVKALDEGEFSAELIQAIGTHCRKRRAEGRTPAYIADELSISEWQVADWNHQRTQQERPPQQEEDSQASPLTYVLSVPLTHRFERLLSREIAKAMQKCDSCCWKQFVASLPGGLTVDREDEQS